MATYLYETVPFQPNEQPETFEVTQSMKDAPLTKHPVTGVPVRRVITGGYGFVSKAKEAPVSSQPPSRGGGCGTGCGCH
jgi:predicted nucleic acid-binding Zn ribbon protein